MGQSPVRGSPSRGAKWGIGATRTRVTLDTVSTLQHLASSITSGTEISSGTTYNARGFPYPDLHKVKTKRYIFQRGASLGCILVIAEKWPVDYTQLVASVSAPFRVAKIMRSKPFLANPFRYYRGQLRQQIFPLGGLGPKVDIPMKLAEVARHDSQKFGP